MIFYCRGTGAAFHTRNLGESDDACTAFGNNGGIAFGCVRFIGRLQQRSARRSGSVGSAGSQRRRRSGGASGPSRTSRPCWAAGPSWSTEPEHPGGQIGLRIGLHGAVPRRRSPSDRVLRSDSQSSAVSGRKRRILRPDSVAGQCPAGRRLRRVAKITEDHSVAAVSPPAAFLA